MGYWEQIGVENQRIREEQEREAPSPRRSGTEMVLMTVGILLWGMTIAWVAKALIYLTTQFLG